MDAEASFDDGYDPEAYRQFDATLAPYGSWEDDPTYGRVWVPAPEVVGDDFEPYASNGEWVDSSDYGWTWVSDWDWGWAPFHYGRWLRLGGHRWCWIPGTTWGPAWVTWRFGGGYAGWAPLPPRGVVIGPPTGSRWGWRFTLAADLQARSPSYVPSSVVATVAARTSPVMSQRAFVVGSSTVRFNAGPSAQVMAQTLGRVVSARALREVAPFALPHVAIVPQQGTPIASRPWVVTANARAWSSRVIRVQPGATRAASPSVSRAPYVPAHPGYVVRAPGATISVGTGSGQMAYRAPAPEYRGGALYVAPVSRPSRGSSAAYFVSPAYPPSATSPASPYHRPPTYEAPSYHAPAAPYAAAPYQAPFVTTQSVARPAVQYAPATPIARAATVPSAPAASSSHHGGGFRR
jgi:hypothetical protein